MLVPRYGTLLIHPTIRGSFVASRPKFLPIRTPHSYMNSRPLSIESSTARLIQSCFVSIKRSFNWLSETYDNVTGISETRLMHDKVADADRSFVETRKHRKACQDKLDSLKDNLASLRDKIDSTSKMSDRYLDLIKENQTILQERFTLDAELARLKDEEEEALDVMSKLLQRNTEMERLRHEKAKLWQIISLTLSFMCSLVYLIHSHNRHKRDTEEMFFHQEQYRLHMESRFDELERQFVELNASISEIRSSLTDPQAASRKAKTSSWWSYLFGWARRMPGGFALKQGL